MKNLFHWNSKDTLAYIWSRICNPLLFLKCEDFTWNCRHKGKFVQTTRKSEFWAFQAAFIGMFSLVLSRNMAILFWKIDILTLCVIRSKIQNFYTKTTVFRLTKILETSMKSPRKAQILLFHVVLIILSVWLQFHVKSSFYKKSRGLQILDHIYAKVSINP